MPDHLEILKHIYLKGGVTLQSNFAREHALQIAMFASRGFLSTATGENTFGNVWRVTFSGLLQLTQHKLV